MQFARVSVCAATVVGCAQLIYNEPVNRPIAAIPRPIEDVRSSNLKPDYDDIEVALTFSGGGMRAAAFAYGVLTGFNDKYVTTSRGAISLLDHIDFISGVSGGSILAAYYGLYGRQALGDFRQQFLLANPEENLQTDVTLFNVARGLEGGINDSKQFTQWLDAHLYHNATFKDLLAKRRPVVWVNASDIYSRTAFLFTPVTFSALCSDLADFPVSLAVAASAAVPLFFTPIVVQNYPGGCSGVAPEWIERVRKDRKAPPIMTSYAEALERYRTGGIKYVKLLDGGLVDNYGLVGITITRLANKTPYGPLEPEEAVKLRRFLFLVVDAGRAPSGAWVQSVAGPSGVDLIRAVSDTATESGVLSSYLLFQQTMNDWQKTLIRWRCGLSEAERRRFGAPPGWNCKDLKFFIDRIGFDGLGPDRAAGLNRIETTLRLPPDEVDMLTAGGRDALNSSAVFRSFLESLPPATRPSNLPVANSLARTQQARAD